MVIPSLLKVIFGNTLLPTFRFMNMPCEKMARVKAVVNLFSIMHIAQNIRIFEILVFKTDQPLSQEYTEKNLIIQLQKIYYYSG